MTINEFVEEIERRAEWMGETAIREGAHYAAMKELQKELNKKDNYELLPGPPIATTVPLEDVNYSSGSGTAIKK